MENGKIVKLIKRIINRPYNILLDYKSAYSIKKNSKRQSGEKIKVAFIVQMPELWDKQSGVYKLMCENKKFEPWMIIVPKYDFKEQKLGEYSEEKEYFISQCINNNYILADDTEYMFNIENEKFDYLFYQRPYDFYLPKSLRTITTVRFTRNCYIPYATPDTKNTTIYPKSFFRNIYLGFMEDNDAVEINIRNLNMFFYKNPRHFMNVGYPTFERCLQLNDHCLFKRFLWTPRWSYDELIGGSHFMEYYAQLTDFHWNDSQFIVRPHPMMWENFLKKGIIDEKKMYYILSTWNEKGIFIDSNKSIEKTFDEIDVMISDRSSIIPMFFLTGKPIIYCPVECEHSELFSTVIPGLYIANNWDELQKYIIMLKNHEDPLLSVRRRIIKERFLYHCSANKNIVDIVWKDHTNNQLSKNCHKNHI